MFRFESAWQTIALSQLVVIFTDSNNDIKFHKF
jgi:hypothetical protein